MTETSPAGAPDVTVPGGVGTEGNLLAIRDLVQAQQINTDHPALLRALAALEDPDGIISAFQSFTS